MPEKNIFLAGIEEQTLSDIATLLKKKGYKLTRLPRINRDLLHRVKQESPDLLVVDISTKPDTESISTAGMISKECDLPVIFLTGETPEKMYEKILKTNPSAIISLPAHPTNLAAAIEIALKQPSPSNDLQKTLGRLKRKEDHLRLSEKQNRILFETMTQGVIYFDAGGFITDVNPAAEKILGLSRMEMIGKTSKNINWGIFDSDGKDFPADKRPAEMAFRTGKPVKNVSIGILNPREQHHRWININAIPVFKDGETEPFQVYATLEDMTERKNYEQALLENKERYRSMFLNNHAVMLIIDPDNGSMIDVNPAACDYYGYSRDEILRMKITDINTLSPEEVEKEMKNAKLEKRKHFIFRHRLKNGEIRDVEVFSGPINIAGKKNLYSIIYDVTDRKKAEAALRRSEEQHRTLFETMAQGVIYFDENGKVLSANSAAAKILSISRDDMIGKEPSDYPFTGYNDNGKEIPPGELPIYSALKTGKPVQDIILSYQIPGENRNRWIIINAIPQYRSGETKPYQVYATYMDITDLRQVQEEINLFFNVTLDMLCIVNFEGYFTKLSPSWSKSLGWSNGELMSRPFMEFIHRDDVEETRAIGASLQERENAINFENRFRCKDGSYKWLSWNSLTLPERKIIIAAAHDITQRKSDEEKLKKSEQRLREAQRVAHLGYWEMDFMDNSLYWSEEVYRIFGISPEHFTPTYEAFLQTIHPDDREHINQRYQESVSLKTDYEVTHRVVRPDGGVRHVFEKCENFFKKDGDIARSLGIVWDITEQVEAEKKLLVSMQEADIAREQAERANRAKSEFLANMSHEIRTPLNAVTGFSELLSSLVSDEQQKNYLESIKTAGKSLLTLINDILDLSKIETDMLEIQYEAINPFSVFREIEQIFAPKITEKGLQFFIEIDPELPPSLVLDETRLRQVLVNIVGNAVKFTAKGHLRLKVQKKYSQAAKDHVDLIITIEDTGIGIPEDDFEIIFESFRQKAGQSNRKYGGTGLGLSISKRLIEIMNGEISFTSREGAGTTFIIRLKEVRISDDTPFTERRRAINPDRMQFKGGRILVADDVESNRRFLSELLARNNLEAHVAKDGREALEMMEINSYDVVIMDIRMPVMNGLEAIQKIRTHETLQNSVVVALTASVLKEDRTRILDAGFNGFLSKPINITDLYREISRYIETESSDKENDFQLTVEQLPLPLHPKLVQRLLNTILPKMEELNGAIKPQLVTELAEDILTLAEEHHNRVLADYSRIITSFNENYNIAGLQSAAKQMIEEIKKSARE